MITKERKSNIVYAILAFFFSLVLFFIANGSPFQSQLVTSPNGYEEVVNDVPVQVLYDDQKFFVQGFDATVSVKLTSANRVQLNSEVSSETRSFRVIADLEDLKEGTHEVRLQVQNMSSGVTADITPVTITVTIEKRVSQSFAVEPSIPAKSLDEGYQLKDVAVSPNKVKIVTGDQTLKEISKVVAVIDPAKITAESSTEKVAVQAIDDKGNVLPAIIDPEEVEVTVSLEAPEKTVELYVAQTGTPPPNVSHYIYRMSQISAEIYGPQSVLAAISQIAVPVDISEISSPVERTYTIPAAEGISVTPQEVIIEITPVYGGSTNSTANTQPDGTSNQGVSSAGSASGSQTNPASGTSVVNQSSSIAQTTETISNDTE